MKFQNFQGLNELKEVIKMKLLEYLKSNNFRNVAKCEILGPRKFREARDMTICGFFEIC